VFLGNEILFFVVPLCPLRALWFKNGGGVLFILDIYGVFSYNYTI